MKLYEIPLKHREALESITIDEETGVIEGREGLETFLRESEGCILNAARYIRELASDINAIKEEKQRLDKRLKTIENRQKFFKKAVMDALQYLQEKKVSDPTMTVSIRKGVDKVFIAEGTELPDEYLLPAKPRDPDKNKIKFDLTDGKEIPGCYLVRESSLSIR